MKKHNLTDDEILELAKKIEKKRMMESAKKQLNKKIKNPLDGVKKKTKVSNDSEAINKSSCKTLKEETGTSLEEHQERFEKYVKGDLSFEEVHLEESILYVVNKNPGLTTMRIVSKLRQDNPNLSESLASQAVWRLADNGKLSLMEDLGFVINTDKKEKK